MVYNYCTNVDMDEVERDYGDGDGDGIDMHQALQTPKKLSTNPFN